MRECIGKNPSPTKNRDNARNEFIESETPYLTSWFSKDELGPILNKVWYESKYICGLLSRTSMPDSNDTNSEKVHSQLTLQI